MEQYKNKILFFADLDDSMFQTINKDKLGKYKATFPKNVLKTSYYTKAQYNLLNFVLTNEEIVFIPLTARTKEQLERTKILRLKQASLYSNYYGSRLFINHKEDKAYSKKINELASISFENIDILIKKVSIKYTDVQFINVDNRYYVSDTKNDQAKKYISELIHKKYPDLEAYVEDKYITILPKIFNKSSVVKYLIKKFKPKMTIGIGNSVSDIDFLNQCDFKIISHIGILHNKVNS
jgi:hypothetical protein